MNSNKTKPKVLIDAVIGIIFGIVGFFVSKLVRLFSSER